MEKGKKVAVSYSFYSKEGFAAVICSFKIVYKPV